MTTSKQNEAKEVQQETEYTSIRIDKTTLLILETEKLYQQRINKHPKMTNGEFIEYLLIKHKIFDGTLQTSDTADTKNKIVKALGINEEFKLTSYYNMRSALFDIMSMIAASKNDKIRKDLNDKFNNILENNDIEITFLLEI